MIFKDNFIDHYLDFMDDVFRYRDEVKPYLEYFKKYHDDYEWYVNECLYQYLKSDGPFNKRWFIHSMFNHINEALDDMVENHTDSSKTNYFYDIANLSNTILMLTIESEKYPFENNPLPKYAIVVDHNMIAVDGWGTLILHPDDKPMYEHEIM